MIRDSLTFDKKMYIMAMTHDFPNHSAELTRVSVPTLVIGGDRKVVGVDERKASEIIFDHIPNAKLALFKDAFDPISTMRRDIFNEMIGDFLQGKDIKTYEGVRRSLIITYTKKVWIS